MKMKKFIQTKPVLVAFCMILPLTAMSDDEQSECGFVEGYDTTQTESYELQDDPFIDIDVAKSIASLPEADKEKASGLFAAINQLEEQSKNKEEISIDDEVRFEVLERRLDELFINADVEYAEIDLLAKLSDENQLKAFKLMRKIGHLESDESYATVESNNEFEQALMELDALLIQSYSL